MNLKKQSVFFLLAYLVVISLFVAQAPITFEKNKNSSGKISFQSTSGTATPIGKGKASGSTSASLTLSGSFSIQGNGEIKLSGLTGTLTIGTKTFTITAGHGVISGKGTVEIQATAMTPAGYGFEQFQLVLHGTSTYTPTQGTLVFTSPQSKLASQYFLSITGQETRTP
jgi:hypothetical protein